MPAAIDRWICAAISKSNKEYSTIYSLNYKDRTVIFPHTTNKFQEIWKQLVATSIDVIRTEFKAQKNVNMVLCGNIPIACGLSSSSALVISITQTFCRLFSLQMEERQLAHLCQKIENKTLGTAGGLLDQYGIIFSKKKCYRCCLSYLAGIFRLFRKPCRWRHKCNNPWRILCFNNYI